MKTHTNAYSSFVDNSNKLVTFANLGIKGFDRISDDHYRWILSTKNRFKDKGFKVDTKELEEVKKRIKELRERIKELRESLVFLPELCFVFLISIWEFYLVDILEEIFKRRKDAFKISDKKIDHETLLSFDSIEQLNQYILEREQEAVLMKSYREVKSHFNKRFGIDFNKSSIADQDLIEMFATRNILIHNKGIINQRYLDQVKNSDFRRGQKRKIATDYIGSSYKKLSVLVSYIDSEVMRKFARKKP